MSGRARFVLLGTGIVLALLILGKSALSLIAGVFALFGFLVVLVLGIAALMDLVNLHRESGEPWGSVDILWAFSFFVFHIVAPIVWLVWGRNVRKEELVEQARRGAHQTSL